MTTRYHEFSDFGVRFEQVKDGIIVNQYSQYYFARNIKLSDDLLEISEKLISAGYTCLIRDRHPRPEKRSKGVDYIGFSASNKESWFAVVDQFSGYDPIKRVTVNKKFRDLLTEAGVQFSWETAGGKNIFVASSDVGYLTANVASSVVRKMLERDRKNFHQFILSGLPSEATLQSLFIENIHRGVYSKVFGNIRLLHVNPRWRNNSDGINPQAWDIPDIIIETETVLWVLELKLNEIGVAAVHQVARYVSNPACFALANGREIRAVALGFYKSPDLSSLTDYLANSVEVLLWKYRFSGSRGLELIITE